MAAPLPTGARRLVGISASSSACATSKELLFERNIVLSHETIRRWHDKVRVCFARHLKAVRRQPSKQLVTLLFGQRIEGRKG